MSTYSDEYRGLIEDARDALRVLLDGSTPDSWLQVRPAYGVLVRSLERDSGTTAELHAAAAQLHAAELHAAMTPSVVWRDVPTERREAVLFQVLGEKALTPREITAAVNAELATPGEEDCWRVVHEGMVKSLLHRMLRAGRLTREPEAFQGKFRYRYSVTRTLEGPIVDLERAYRDDDGSQGGES